MQVALYWRHVELGFTPALRTGRIETIVVECRLLKGREGGGYICATVTPDPSLLLHACKRFCFVSKTVANDLLDSYSTSVIPLWVEYRCNLRC